MAMTQQFPPMMGGMPPGGGPGMGMPSGPGARAHLYVGNLSPRVTEHMLAQVFSVAGPVLGIKLIPDRNFQHNGLNYGFVEYHTMGAAENALQILNGRKVFETEIKVNWAYQNQTQKEDLSTHFHVFVGDLSPEITDDTLRKAFVAFGSLSDARVMWDLNTGKSRGYGFLAFREKPDAEQAITAMNGEWLGSRAIRVNWANQRTGGTGGPMEPGTGAAGGPVRISNLPPFLGPPGAGGPQPSGQDAGPDSYPQMMPGGPSSYDNLEPSYVNQPQAPVTFVQTKPLTYDVVVQQAPPSNSTVYVGNLAPYAQNSDIMPLFQGFGYVVEIRLQADRGFAFVKLDTHQNAAMAIVNVNGTSVHGRAVKCSWGKDKLGSDTSIISRQANGVTSPPTTNSVSQTLSGYTGWPYTLPNGQQLGNNKVAGSALTSPQASYFAQYYNHAGAGHMNGQNGVST